MERALVYSPIEQKVMTMESFNAQNGICSTCIHLENCEHVQHSKQAIWFCEDFDCGRPDKQQQPVETTAPSPPPQMKNGYMGLCVNCDLRENCMNAKRPGGVWHCEEYQ